MPWYRQLVAGLSLQWVGFTPRSVHAVFVVDKMALGQVFLQVLQFSPVNIIPLWLSILIYHMGGEQQAHWWLQFRDVVSPH
jgi:branched-subunit amino acid transport protein